MKYIAVAISMLMLSFGSVAQTAPDNPPVAATETGKVWAQTLSAANLKASADGSISAQTMMNQAMATAFANVMQTGADNYRNVSAIRETVLAVALKGIMSMDPKEALSLTKAMQSDQAQQIMSLISGLSAGREAASLPPAGGQ